MTPGEDRGIRVVVTGKGGVGKTTIAALLAHHLAREGRTVLAVDGDPQRNLAATLGIRPGDAERIVPVADHAEYLRQKIGAGPDLSLGGLLTLNPDVSDVAGRFAVPAGDRLRLLVMGGVRQAGAGCLCPEYTLLSAVLRQVPRLPDEVILLDTPAGLEHFGRALAEGFHAAIVVADPTYNALTVARESAALAQQLGIPAILLVINRVRSPDDELDARAMLAGYTNLLTVPFDPSLARMDPSVADEGAAGPAVRGQIRALADAILALPR